MRVFRNKSGSNMNGVSPRYTLTARRSERYPRLAGCAAVPSARRGPVRLPMVVEEYAERMEREEVDVLRCVIAIPVADDFTSIV